LKPQEDSASNPPVKSEVSFQASIDVYRQQLAKGVIQTAYKAVMSYLDGLRLLFEKKYPDFYVSSIHYGFMDYSYFYFFPKQLKQQKLKIVLIFAHETFRFEVWLAGYNKNVQAKYWNLFKEANYNKHHVPASINGVDSIVEHVLVKNADFSNPDALTSQIEDGALKFIADIEEFISTH
jgi:hypothetical protein